jgi:hypothetical protein
MIAHLLNYVAHAVAILVFGVTAACTGFASPAAAHRWLNGYN